MRLVPRGSLRQVRVDRLKGSLSRHSHVSANRRIALRSDPIQPCIRSFDKSPRWVLQKRPVTFDPKEGRSTTLNNGKGSSKQRPCAVFEYCCETMEQRDALRLIAG